MRDAAQRRVYQKKYESFSEARGDFSHILGRSGIIRFRGETGEAEETCGLVVKEGFIYSDLSPWIQDRVKSRHEFCSIEVLSISMCFFKHCP